MNAIRNVRIRRLVLDGIEQADRYAVVESFRAELARLLADYPDRLPERAPTHGDSPAGIGRRAAAAVHAKVIAAC